MMVIESITQSRRGMNRREIHQWFCQQLREAEADGYDQAAAALRKYLDQEFKDVGGAS